MWSRFVPLAGVSTRKKFGQSKIKEVTFLYISWRKFFSVWRHWLLFSNGEDYVTDCTFVWIRRRYQDCNIYLNYWEKNFLALTRRLTGMIMMVFYICCSKAKSLFRQYWSISSKCTLNSEKSKNVLVCSRRIIV